MEQIEDNDRKMDDSELQKDDLLQSGDEDKKVFKELENSLMNEFENGNE